MTWQDAGEQTPPGGRDDEATRPDWEPAQPGDHTGRGRAAG